MSRHFEAIFLENSDGWTARVVYKLEFGFNEWVSAVTQIHHTTYTHTRAHTQMHIENHINKENTGADTQHTDFEWHLHNYQLQANEVASYVFASIFIFFRLSCQLSKSILLCALRVDEFFSIHSKIKSFAFSLCSAPAQTNAVFISCWFFVTRMKVFSSFKCVVNIVLTRTDWWLFGSCSDGRRKYTLALCVQTKAQLVGLFKTLFPHPKSSFRAVC